MTRPRPTSITSRLRLLRASGARPHSMAETQQGHGPRVLVVSARMGAGHDGAARELCRRLESRGATTRTVDFLDAAPIVGWFLRRGYELQLEAAPWSYEALYRIWFVLPFLCYPLTSLLSIVFGRRIRRWARELGADAIVSTYPLASVVLGHMRERRRVRVPVATFLTDFAVHPLWIHRAVDLHMCVHPRTAREVRRRCGSYALAPGPLVSDRFTSQRPPREQARQVLPGLCGGLGSKKMVLLVAGAWGVGELERTFDEVLASGRYVPVAVCGNNDRLRKKLSSRQGGVALGWTDQMPELMAAADVLVQNGGGLTCMESFAAGLPVITCRPIPGHGRQNAIEMHEAGVAEYAEDPSTLVEILDAVTTLPGRRMAGRAREIFRSDAADCAIELASIGEEPAPARLGPVGKRVAALALAGASALAGLNLLADAATAVGIGALHPRGHDTYLAVRLGPQSLNDPDLPALLSRARASAIVEGQLALRYPAAVRRLATAGIPLANGGWGTDSRFHLLAADDGVVRADEEIRKAAGIGNCAYFAPDTAVTGVDLASAHLEHEHVVGPSVTVKLSSAGSNMRGGVIYVLDAEQASASGLHAAIGRLEGAAATRRVHVEPLAKLA